MLELNMLKYKYIDVFIFRIFVFEFIISFTYLFFFASQRNYVCIEIYKLLIPTYKLIPYECKEYCGSR